MSSTTQMAPSIQALLDKDLPHNGQVNTLVLGERHDESGHFDWLHDHLDTLIGRHGVTTIGREIAAFDNIFLWAYQDGTLAKALGSQENARSYLRTVLSMSVVDLHKDSEPKEIKFLIAAMDKGIRVVGYDTRDSYGKSKRLLKELSEQPEAQVRTTLRELEHGEKALGYELREIDWLLKLNPDYQKRFFAIEKLVSAGHEQIEADKMSSDGLSAVMFDALATRKGNRLLIAGEDHVDASYWLSTDPNPNQPNLVEQVYGGLPQQLFAQAKLHHPHAVTGSVTAAVIVSNEAAYRTHLRDKQVGKQTDPGREEMTLLNLTRGNVSHVEVSQLSAEKVLDYLLPLTRQPGQKTANTVMDVVDPRRFTRINRLAQEVNELENGPEQAKGR